MVRIFRHYVPGSLLFLGMVEHLYLISTMYIALFFRWADLDQLFSSLERHLPQAVSFATVFTLTMFALGLYNKEHVRDLGAILTRLLFSFFFGSIALAFLFYIQPDLAIWRSALAIAFVDAIVGIMAIRWIYLRFADIQAFKRRVLILGIGEKAAKIEALETGEQSQGFICVAYVPLSDKEKVITEEKNVIEDGPLPHLVTELDVEEIVVAVDERRGSMPIQALLECKLQGISVVDYSEFWERETGRMDLDALHPSWLIFSDGFVGGWLQVALKRQFDIFASLLLLIFSLPVLVLSAIVIKLDSAGPIFYRQERVGLNGENFMLFKFRSMGTDAEEDGVPRWAQENDSRITRVGALLRKSRIDEIPQIFNVLKGEMSFIGPRPERPFFVNELRQVIPHYFERHRVKPGISGWAQLNYPYGASVEDAKKKFQYDLYYIKNYSLFLDLIVLIQTVRVILWPQGVR
ncbi:MAG: TIGR03013 family PEP-CTERM/XrtA system glycosyltransferase [Alphaproteobacteria bacterium]|nr:TIGR03013 family PEP-CTERM/XrtA system glycosyltransferase [Alphaproteobacteria bacterium]